MVKGEYETDTMKAVLIRRWSLILGIAILAGSMFVNKVLTGMKAPPKQESAISAIPLVQVRTIRNDTVRTRVEFTGRLRSKTRIDVFTEVTGKLLGGTRAFKEGVAFRKGEVLLRIDDTDARMSLTAARSALQSQITLLLADLKTDYAADFEPWKAYVDGFDPEARIERLPEAGNDKLKNFLVAKNIYNQYYNIKSQEARLAKYIVRAPFSGVVSAANVSSGAIIRAGQRVGEFITTGQYEMEAGVSPSMAARLKPGTPVDLRDINGDGQWTGKVHRISKSIDAGTQTMKAYIDVSGADLYEGLYLSGSTEGEIQEAAARIGSHLIREGRFVFVVQDSILKQREVRILSESDGKVVVKGLETGSSLLNQVLNGAREGMKVKPASAS